MDAINDIPEDTPSVTVFLLLSVTGLPAQIELDCFEYDHDPISVLASLE